MAATGLLNPSHAVYALSTDGENHRYIGYTTKKIRQRLSMHRWEAKHDNPAKLYDWMREVGPDNVIVTVLEKLPTDSTLGQLGGEREAHWIARLRGEGYDLINKTTGGPGMPGVKPTAEQLAARSERARLQIQAHNHLQTPENREKRRAAHVGIKHKKHEFKDIQAQVVSGARGAHNRWHVARGIINNDCTHCVLGR